MKRLFLGIPVSEEVKTKVQVFYDALQEIGADLNLVSFDNLHFTVKFLGSVDDNKIPEIVEKMNDLVSTFSSFSLKLQGTGAFPSEEKINVIWIGLKDERLIALIKATNEVLDYIHQEDYAETVPHLTIARVKSAKNKKQLQKVLQKFQHQEFGGMLIDKIVLFESLLTPQGPVYQKVAEFLLPNN